MKPTSFGLTMSSLSQAPPLEDLSPSHGAFQGHATHPVQRRTELSPNGSPATWYHSRIGNAGLRFPEALEKSWHMVHYASVAPGRPHAGESGFLGVMEKFWAV